MSSVYRRSVFVFGTVAIGLGLAILVKTAWDGGTIGYVFGALFVALGAGRIHLARRQRGV
ncbi:MAG: hypothetical protein ACYDCH_10510 [Gaiellaceae bacterium]